MPENVDDATHRIGSIKTGARSLQDLDSADFLPRYSIPIYPSAKWIVYRNAISQHEGTPGTARLYASQCYALARRIGGPASGASKETKALNLSQSIVKRQSRCVGKVSLRNDNYTARGIIDPRLSSRGGHGHLFTHASRRHNDIQSRVGRFRRPFAFEK